MTSLLGEFDKHRDISYLGIDHLFWNTYPFKVVVFEDLPRPEVKEFGWGYNRDNVAYEAWLKHRQARNAFFYARRRHVPEDKKLWKSMNNGGHTFSFFFKQAEDALHFIQKNRKHITTVYRPENEKQIAALGADRKRVLRDTLYYDRYRYCVEFHEQMGEDETNLDDMVQSIFLKKNAKRYLYTYSKRRRLYLKNENDIFHVKIALYEKIRSQTEAFLKQDI